MLIQCILERDGGSVVPFSFPDQPDYREYHFLPNAAGDQVAVVTDEGDIATLLSITSAYQEYIEAPTATDPLAFIDSLDLPDLQSLAVYFKVTLDPALTLTAAAAYLKGVASAKE